jgi:hypothetical protein
LELANSFGIQYWPIFEIASGQHIGCAGLRLWQPSEQIYELGYHLRPAHWGKGYAIEAGKVILKYGIQNCNASAIIVRHHPENFASKKVYRLIVQQIKVNWMKHVCSKPCLPQISEFSKFSLLVINNVENWEDVLIIRDNYVEL